MGRAVRIPVGPRKISRLSDDPIIFIGRDFRHLIGRRVLVEIILLEDGEDVNRVLDMFLSDMKRRLEERRKRREAGRREAGAGGA